MFTTSANMTYITSPFRASCIVTTFLWEGNELQSFHWLWGILYQLPALTFEYFGSRPFMFYVSITANFPATFNCLCSVLQLVPVLWTHVQVVRPHACCAIVHLLKIYRAFHNVLQDYINLLYENRRTGIYETCTYIRNNSNIFFQ